jgi:hypothetical protein
VEDVVVVEEGGVEGEEAEEDVEAAVAETILYIPCAPLLLRFLMIMTAQLLYNMLVECL